MEQPQLKQKHPSILMKNYLQQIYGKQAPATNEAYSKNKTGSGNVSSTATPSTSNQNTSSSYFDYYQHVNASRPSYDYQKNQ